MRERLNKAVRTALAVMLVGTMLAVPIPVSGANAFAADSDVASDASEYPVSIQGDADEAKATDASAASSHMRDSAGSVQTLSESASGEANGNNVAENDAANDPSDSADQPDQKNSDDPAGSQGSDDPADPVDPVDPVDPADPVEPSDPTNPDDPLDPIDPSDPIEPVEPTNPDDPTDPENPSDPAQSDAPAFASPDTGALPDAVAGKPYWDTKNNKPKVKFQAAGNPQPVFELEQLSSGDKRPQAKRTVDSDGDVYWTGGGLPQGLALNEETGEIEGTPSEGAQDGYLVIHEFTVIARNASGTDARTFTMQVTDESQKPEEPDLAEVPNVVGSSQSAAIRRLTRAGLGVHVETVQSERPAGEVVSQTPEAGEQAQKGATVNLAVSEGPQEQQDPVVVSVALYAHSTNTRGEYGARIGSNGRELRDGSWWVPQGLTEKGQRIRLCAAVQRSDGRAFYQNTEEWPDDLVLQWTTSDSRVAVVTSTGVVVATGDGECAITATSPEGVTSSINLSVMGQSGHFPEQVEVIDEEGEPYGDERITYSKVEAPSLQLYARVTFSDGATVSNCPVASDYDTKDETLKTLSWSTTNTEKGYINNETGLFVPRGYATLKAVAQVAGGDADVNGGKVQGYVWIVIDSGEYVQANPSNILHVRVTYEADESRTAFERDFTVDELRLIENAQATYTFTKDEGEYVTASARGIYLTTLLAHVRKEDGGDGQQASMGVDVADVYGFRLAANDGVNPGLITANFIFQARYYLPNYEFGANTSGAVNVFPMLAYESNWRDSARGARDSREDYASLDSGTRFRLMFGSEGTHDSASSKSLKYIYSLTIILNGAPPAQIDDPDDSQGTGGNPGDSGEPGGNGQPGGDPDGTGSDSPDGAGAGISFNPKAGAKGADARNRTAGPQAISDAGGRDSADASQSETQEENSAQENATGQQGQQGDNTEEAQDFNVYQMISNAKTNFQYEDWENPYLPWTLPLVLAVAALGALSCLVQFKRQLVPRRMRV